MRIFVVGGGPSLKGFDFQLLRGASVVVCNRAVLDVPWAQWFITIDYSLFRRVPTIRQFLTTQPAIFKYFVANFAGGQLRQSPSGLYCTKTGRVRDLSFADKVIFSRKREGLSRDWADFRNGDNSGYCALQLAVLLGAKEIYLLGIDLTTTSAAHYHDAYRLGGTAKLKRYYQSFCGGIRHARSWGIKIYSCSEISRLNGLLGYRNPSEVLRA